ncbi:lytic transglycosylase domain-containing protein [bacterium]|nr:lytic transglycosylase domain-containing protein [bacterium]
MFLKDKKIIDNHILLLGILIITLTFKNANAATDQSLISSYLNGNYKDVIEQVDSKQEEELDIEDIYILLKANEQAGKTELNPKILEKLEAGIPTELYDIIIYERILLSINSDDKESFLRQSIEFIPKTNNEHIIRIIAENIVEKYRTFKDTLLLRQCLELLLTSINSLEIKSSILKVYADTFDDSDSKKTHNVIEVWKVEDIRNLSEKYEKIGQWILERADTYPNQILEHFINQKQYRNYSYSIKNIPHYLKALSNRELESYQKLSDLYLYSMKRLRKYSQLIAILDNTSERELLGIPREEAMIELFDLWLRKGNEKEATNILMKIKKAKPDYSPDFMLLALADFNFEKANYKKSLNYHQQIDISSLSNEIISRIKWKKWRIHYQLGDQKELLELAKWAETYPFENKEIAARFCYWSNKLEAKQNSSLSSCYEQYPLTYYGLHSKYSSNITDLATVKNEKKQSVPKIELSSGKLKIYSFIATLYELRQYEIADTIVKSIIEKANGHELLHLADILLKANRFYLVQLIVESNFRDHLEGSITARNMLLPYFYPKAYREEIIGLVQTDEVPELLILSVMREESHFNPDVESTAGAIGLMQLMPKTAEYIGKLLKLKIEKEQLKDPKLNLRLGTAYLNRLLNRYKGDLFYTLAAYNGGPTNVRRWQKKNITADSDEFLESITFDETQNYIRRVMRSYYLYQDLYGQAL